MPENYYVISQCQNDLDPFSKKIISNSFAEHEKIEIQNLNDSKQKLTKNFDWVDVTIEIAA